MKRSVLRGLKGSLLLLLWLLLVQFVSSLLSVVVIVILGAGHPVGPTPLWEWIIFGGLSCLFWFVMGWVITDVIQLRPAGAFAVLTIWTIVTSLMQNVYLLFLPQQTCGGMCREILQFLRNDPGVRLDDYLDLPIGCFLLSAALGAGMLFRRKHTKSIYNRSEESA